MTDTAKIWRHRTGEIRLDRTRVMGILNVTPDSFSDGGRYLDADQALRHGIEMVEHGADLLDVGGESTRPGSDPVSADEEWRRGGPVIRDRKSTRLNSSHSQISYAVFSLQKKNSVFPRPPCSRHGLSVGHAGGFRPAPAPRGRPPEAVPPRLPAPPARSPPCVGSVLPRPD